MNSLVKCLLLPSALMILSSCGGGSDDSEQKETPTPRAPTVTISAAVTELFEGDNVEVTHSASSAAGASITSSVSCDMGELEDNVYTAPNVINITTATCTATATADGITSSASLEFTITPKTPELALSGGETSIVPAKVSLFDVSFAQLQEGLIDATLNDSPIKVAVTDSNQLVFLPALNVQGNQVLSLEIEGQQVSVEFESSAVDTVENPSSYVNEYLLNISSQVEERIVQAQVNGLTTTELERLTSIKEEIAGIQLNTLSDDELTYLAHIISNNLETEDDSSSSLRFDSSYARTSYNSVVDLTSCERSAIRVVASGGLAYLTTLSAAGLAGSGVGIPVSIAVVVGAAASWNIFDYELGRMGVNCFEWAENDIQNIATSEQRKRMATLSIKDLAKPTKTNRVNSSEFAFVHNEQQQFELKRKYKIIEGAEGYVADIVGTANTVMRGLNSLVQAVGENNTPDFIKELISEPLTLEDLLYEDISPSSVRLEQIENPLVSGSSSIVDGSFALLFTITDLDQDEIDFSLVITDLTDTSRRSEYEASISLNPPIAYDESFEIQKGRVLNAQLQADYATSFEVVTQAEHGVVNLLDASTGLFSYTPSEELEEDTIDQFTFIAKNGSVKNDGESDIATITIDISVLDLQACLIGNQDLNVSSDISGANATFTETETASGYVLTRTWQAMQVEGTELWYGRLQSEVVTTGPDSSEPGRVLQEATFYTEELTACDANALKTFKRGRNWNPNSIYSVSHAAKTYRGTVSGSLKVPIYYKGPRRLDSRTHFRVTESGNYSSTLNGRPIIDLNYSLRVNRDGSHISLPDGQTVEYVGEVSLPYSLKKTFNVEIKQTDDSWQSVITGPFTIEVEDRDNPGSFLPFDTYEYVAKQNTDGTWSFGPEGQATIGCFCDYVWDAFWEEHVWGEVLYGTVNYKMYQQPNGEWWSLLDGTFSIPERVQQQYIVAQDDYGNYFGFLQGTHWHRSEVKPINSEGAVILRAQATTEFRDSSFDVVTTSLVETSNFTSAGYLRTTQEYQWFQALGRPRQSLVVTRTTDSMRLPEGTFDYMKSRDTFEARQRGGVETGEYQSVQTKREVSKQNSDGVWEIETTDYEVYMSESGDWYSRPID